MLIVILDFHPTILELPRVPVIYANSARQYGPVSGMYDEETDLALICEVTGGTFLLTLYL